LNVNGKAGSSLSLTNINAQFSNVNNKSELQITATASLWQQDSVSVLFVFFYESNALDFYMEFDADLDELPLSLVPNSTNSWFSGLSLTGTNEISISTASFTDNSGNQYKRGKIIFLCYIHNTRFVNHC
jgi:hypothetical protein